MNRNVITHNHNNTDALVFCNQTKRADNLTDCSKLYTLKLVVIEMNFKPWILNAVDRVHRPRFEVTRYRNFDGIPTIVIKAIILTLFRNNINSTNFRFVLKKNHEFRFVLNYKLSCTPLIGRLRYLTRFIFVK